MNKVIRKIKEYWNQSNKTYGMCAITTLIVNDYFGGDIGKVYVGDISHYFNILNGKIIDLTKNSLIYNLIIMIMF